MPTGKYIHKTNANSARKLEDTANSINLIKRRSRSCEEATYKNNYIGGIRQQMSTCGDAVGIVMRDGKETWLCKKCFDIECDKLQETIREQTDLRPWYGRQELVIYE